MNVWTFLDVQIGRLPRKQRTAVIVIVVVLVALSVPLLLMGGIWTLWQRLGK